MEILQVFLLVLQECQPKTWPGERLFASSPPYAIVVWRLSGQRRYSRWGHSTFLAHKSFICIELYIDMYGKDICKDLEVQSEPVDVLNIALLLRTPMKLWPKGGLQCYSFGVIAGHKVLKELHHELIWTHMDSLIWFFLCNATKGQSKPHQTAFCVEVSANFEVIAPFPTARQSTRHDRTWEGGPSRHDERIVIVLYTLLCSSTILDILVGGFLIRSWPVNFYHQCLRWGSSLHLVGCPVACCRSLDMVYLWRTWMFEDVWSQLCIPSWMYNFAERLGSLCIASRVRMRSKWAIMQLLGSASAAELVSVSCSCRMWTNVNNRSMDLVCQLLAMSASLCIWSLSLRHVPRIWRIPRGKAAWITGGVLEHLLFFNILQDFRSRNFSNMSRSQANLSTGFAVHLEAAGKPSGFSSVESIGLAVWIELIGHDRTV